MSRLEAPSYSPPQLEIPKLIEAEPSETVEGTVTLNRFGDCRFKLSKITNSKSRCMVYHQGRDLFEINIQGNTLDGTGMHENRIRPLTNVQMENILQKVIDSTKPEAIHQTPETSTNPEQTTDPFARPRKGIMSDHMVYNSIIEKMKQAGYFAVEAKDLPDKEPKLPTHTGTGSFSVATPECMVDVSIPDYGGAGLNDQILFYFPRIQESKQAEIDRKDKVNFFTNVVFLKPGRNAELLWRDAYHTMIKAGKTDKEVQQFLYNNARVYSTENFLKFYNKKEAELRDKISDNLYKRL